MRTLVVLGSVLLLVPVPGVADILVLKDGTYVAGDVQGLLDGKIESIPGPDGTPVSLKDAAATHIGTTEEDVQAYLKKDGDPERLKLSLFRNDKVVLHVWKAAVVHESEEQRLIVDLLLGKGPLPARGHLGRPCLETHLH